MYLHLCIISKLKIQTQIDIKIKCKLIFYSDPRTSGRCCHYMADCIRCREAWGSQAVFHSHSNIHQQTVNKADKDIIFSLWL